MARPIITEDLVKRTADDMMAEGTDPSIMAVQARIGGGSFTTVKKFLDLWRSKRVAGDAATLDLPPEVAARGQEFVSATWSLAKQLAQKESQATKEAAMAEVAAVRAELSQALQEVARLEASEAQRQESIAHLETKLRESEIALAEAQAQARRTSELDQALGETRRELAASQKEATAKAVEAGRMAGEVEALRKQVQEQMDALKEIAKEKNREKTKP